MSYLLELLGRGLHNDLGDLLDRYFWSPPRQSIQQLQASCLACPDRVDVHFQLGLAHLRSLRLDDAIACLLQACRRKPDYLAARLALAAAFDEKGQTAQALEHLQIANQNQGGEAPVLFAIALCLEKLQRPTEAAEYYRDVIARSPGFVPARERLAAVAVVLDQLDEAIQQYRCLVEADDGPRTRTALAHLYFRRGDYDVAVEEFEAAIAMEPENWTLIDDEVEALIAGGHLREAVERLHNLIEQREGDPFADLYVRLGDLYSQTGDDPAAVLNYRKALDLQADYLEATVKLGTHHLGCGRWEEAADAFYQASEINDQALTNYIGMGVAQEAAGRRAEAMNSFDLAAAVEPNSTLLLTEMARLQLKAAVAEEFHRAFEVKGDPAANDVHLDNDDLMQRQIERHAEEIQRHPHHADLRYRYGVLLRSEGRLGEALEQFEKALAINPAYTKAIIKLGITQQELGQIEQAVETFRRALDLKPQYVDLHYRLGLLYTDRRQFEEAVRHLEKAAEHSPGNQQIRAMLALSLQNMGLMDRAAATWRSLRRLHQATA